MSSATINFGYAAGPPFEMWPLMMFGHSQNTQRPASYPRGMDLIRLWDDGTRWVLLEPLRGAYNWGVLDARLDAAEAAGVEVVYVFGSTPAWTAQPVAGAPNGAYDPTSNRPPLLSDFTNFVCALVAHVRRPDGTLRIKYWEAWNETNAAGFWCGTMDQLYAQQQVLYTTVKLADATAMVTTPTPCWNKTSIDQEIDVMLGMGFQAFANIVSFHGYIANGQPATAIGPVLDAVNAVMAKHGCQHPLWDTESGYNSPANIPDVQKRQWVTDWIMTRLTKGVEAAIWYQWDNQTHGAMCDLSGNLTVAGQAWMDVFRALHAMPQG